MRDRPLALLCVVAASGCSYDWDVPADAAADAVHVEASGSDAAPGTDASTESAATPDASTDTSAMDAPDVVEAAPLAACTASQEMTVQQDRAQALDCTGVTPMPCETMVTDECGCLVYVATTNQAKQNYVDAIQTLKAMCIPSCPGCGTAPSPGVCLIVDAGAGVYACYQ